MYGFLAHDPNHDTPALATIDGAIIVGTRDEMAAWPGTPVLLPDSIGPWILGTDIIEQGRATSDAHTETQ